MKLSLVLCLTLAGCSDIPKVDWPAGKAGVTPALLPMGDLMVPTSPALDSRGTALAAQAAALRVRATAIGGT